MTVVGDSEEDGRGEVVSRDGAGLFVVEPEVGMKDGTCVVVVGDSETEGRGEVVRRDGAGLLVLEVADGPELGAGVVVGTGEAVRIVGVRLLEGACDSSLCDGPIVGPGDWEGRLVKVLGSAETVGLACQKRTSV